jgi:transposase
MFFRTKKSGPRTYLQIVENRREGPRIKQRVIATLGRVEELQTSGQLDGLLRSGARLADQVLLLSAQERGELPVVNAQRIGAVMIFERLWQETGCAAVVQRLLRQRQFSLPMERAIFLTVLHRLLVSGSDRAAARWCRDYAIAEGDGVQLHQLYRAMAWLGEVLPEHEQTAATPWSPRCVKDQFEEELFARRRDLFSSLEVVFFDTTSVYFEGGGGETLGQYGHSKDHRPDRKQMLVGMVLDNAGQPLCCELWPGNVTDVKTLIPIVDRLRRRFAIGRVCIVADRGMISEETIAALESDERGWQYILGVRMRRQREVSQAVLRRAGRYHVVREPGTQAKGPAPLKVKEVRVARRRYIVCYNADQASKDAASREAIVQGLREQLKRGDNALVGNKGYRRYLSVAGQGFRLDEAKIAADARYDGKWVLRTNTDLEATEVALKYKQLWQVEAIFRSTKSLLETRPIFHKCDETIRGHVFCSFLALVLRKALQDRLAAQGHALEWAQVIEDLEALQEIDVIHHQKHFRLRTEARGSCGKVFHAVGVALPPTVRQMTETASA